MNNVTMEVSKLDPELRKQILDRIEREFKHALEMNHKNLSGFEIIRANNINHTICYHDIDPILLKNPNQNQVFDIYLTRAFKYYDPETNINVDAFRWEQCVGNSDIEKYGVGCGKIYYYPTKEFVSFIEKEYGIMDIPQL
jgi:hypothetical protein